MRVIWVIIIIGMVAGAIASIDHTKFLDLPSLLIVLGGALGYVLAKGKSKHFIMGCYGIGVSRLLSAIIEQNHDEKGCIWTKYSSPFQIHIIVSNAKDENELNMGMNLYNDLKKDNIEVIIDDRVNFRFGFKIRDYELLGVPYAIIVGKKLKDNILEIVDRKTLNKIEVEVHNIKEKILSLINKN